MIVCIGDSITYGQYLKPPAQAWPRLIERHDIFAAGVSSDTTRLGLERFPRDVQEVEPAGVVIQFGHNDSNRWETDRGLPRVSRGAFEANLIEMVDRCRAFGARPFLCAITPSYRSEQHAKDVETYNDVVSLVAWNEKVDFIDVRTAFGTERSLLLEDGLHLSESGHQLYAQVVQAWLDRRWP